MSQPQQITCPDCGRKTHNWYQTVTRKLCFLCYEKEFSRGQREEMRNYTTKQVRREAGS